MNPIAVAEIVIVSVYLMLPFIPAANPFNDAFEWKFMNYAPIVTLGALLILVVWWELSAKKWFKGPKHTIDEAVIEAFSD
jgi:energy-converting hydrogenase Eha subunit A